MTDCDQVEKLMPINAPDTCRPGKQEPVSKWLPDSKHLLYLPAYPAWSQDFPRDLETPLDYAGILFGSGPDWLHGLSLTLTIHHCFAAFASLFSDETPEKWTVGGVCGTIWYGFACPFLWHPFSARRLWCSRISRHSQPDQKPEKTESRPRPFRVRRGHSLGMFARLKMPRGAKLCFLFVEGEWRFLHGRLVWVWTVGYEITPSLIWFFTELFRSIGEKNILVGWKKLCGRKSNAFLPIRLVLRVKRWK